MFATKVEDDGVRGGERVHPPGFSDVVATPCPVLAMNVGDTDIDSLEEVRGRSEATVTESVCREAVRIVRSETIPVCEDAGGR